MCTNTTAAGRKRNERIGSYHTGEQWYVRIGNTSYKLSIDDMKAFQGEGRETDKTKLIRQVARNRLDNLREKAENKYKRGNSSDNHRCSHSGLRTYA